MSSDLVAYSEIPAVADSESHGPNMETVVGESVSCFSGEWSSSWDIKLLLDKVIYPELDKNDYLTTEH